MRKTKIKIADTRKELCMRILSINEGWESNIGYPIRISVIFYIRCQNLIEIGPGEGKFKNF